MTLLNCKTSEFQITLDETEMYDLVCKALEAFLLTSCRYEGLASSVRSSVTDIDKVSQDGGALDLFIITFQDERIEEYPAKPKEK